MTFGRITRTDVSRNMEEVAAACRDRMRERAERMRSNPYASHAPLYPPTAACLPGPMNADAPLGGYIARHTHYHQVRKGGEGQKGRGSVTRVT